MCFYQVCSSLWYVLLHIRELGKYHKRLEATEKYLIALQIIEMLPEGNRNEQYGKLIDYIFENVNKQ